MNDIDPEFFEERAGIREFEGGQSREEAEEDLFRDAEAMRRVLAVHHDEVRAVTLPQHGQFARDGIASGPAHHVAQEDHAHAKVSCSVIT